MSLMASKWPALKSDCRSRRCENSKDFGKRLSRTMIDEEWSNATDADIKARIAAWHDPEERENLERRFC